MKRIIAVFPLRSGDENLRGQHRKPRKRIAAGPLVNARKGGRLRSHAGGSGPGTGATGLRWKYTWMRPLFEWKAADGIQRALPQLEVFSKSLDKAIYRLEIGKRRS